MEIINLKVKMKESKKKKKEYVLCDERCVLKARIFYLKLFS